MRTRRPNGIGRMPSVARSLSERARAPQPAAETGAAAIDAAEAAVSGLGIGLGGLFAALREAAGKLGEAGGKAPEAGDGRVVFGYSVRTLGGAEAFGNLAPDGSAPDAAAPRQPIIDVHAEGADIVVIAELPGVDEAGVAVALDGDALLITAPGWRKRLDLPAAVRPDSLRRTCRNGILEVRLARRDGAAP